jgi:glycosyltransferase involved in cell wall biosynthesis
VKVLIVSTIVPFLEGGGTFIVDWLAQALKQNGHTVDVVKIPFHSYYADMPEQMLALRLLDLSGHGDLLIALRTPSYIISHPHKVVWFLHHHRGAYDLWGTPYQDIPSTPEGLDIKRSIIETDNTYLRESKRIFTISRRVSARLKEYNNLDSETLYPALVNPASFRCGEFGNYLFYPSRICLPKRQYLAVESMKYTRSEAKLVIAGYPDTVEQLEKVKMIISQNHLQNKVKLISGWISEEEKIKLYAESLGCLFIPFDEDYGFVTLEAFSSAKPVITCTDSGGPVEFVENEVNGFTVPPDPQAIAAAIDKLYYDKELARRMGRAALEKIGNLNITWDNIVKKLTG